MRTIFLRRAKSRNISETIVIARNSRKRKMKRSCAQLPSSNGTSINKKYVRQRQMH